MNVGKRMGDFGQSAGLFVINLVARFGRSEFSTHAYGTDPRQQLDWYRVDESAPTVIFFYGGNWRSGKKHEFRFVADTICRMGCNAVVVDYRLFPGYRFQEILQDAQHATNYIMGSLVSKGQVFLMGHSAGAQIAALLSLNQALVDQYVRIAGFIGISGPYDFFPFTEDDHWQLFGPIEQYPLSQPVNFVHAKAPKLYLLHGADDTRVRRGHSKSLLEKQRQAGGSAERETYEGMGHIDAIVSFSFMHRRQSKLIRDIQLFIKSHDTFEPDGT